MRYIKDNYGMDYKLARDIELHSEAAARYEPNLLRVYIAWAVLIVLPYPLRRWYGEYKARQRDHWWLSYL